jgi:tRNA modification GTPase
MFSTDDTIVAIATAPGTGGIGVVRVSGPDVRTIERQLLALDEPLVPRRATYTQVVSSAAGATLPIDRVIAIHFASPASFTGEDVLEVSAHGSPVVLEEIVRAAVAAGARLAEPGEFTLRAFLNGRIDLVQAEAVADLVEAVTPLQARAAFDQLEGTLTTAIAGIERSLFEIISRLEASIDFPEEGYHFIQPAEVGEELYRITTDLDSLLADAGRGRVIREGRQVAVTGSPNVGKSTLFNALVGSDRAIVTAIAGTTRDLVTETTSLCGTRICLVDTAGIRSPGDRVEQEGVARARSAAETADLVLVVLDRSRSLEAEDRDLLRRVGPSRRLVVVNKCDLPAAWGAADLGEAGEVVEVSLKTGDGADALRERLCARLLGEERTRDTPAVTNLRHITLLQRARDALARAAGPTEGAPMPEEFLLSDLQESLNALQKITGKRTSEDLLRNIFAKFCVGK